MKFQVFRSHASDYLGKDFIQKEEQELQSLEQINYLHKREQIEPGQPLILLGSSQSDYESYAASDYPGLELVIHANSGFDNISVPWCESLIAPIVAGHQIRKKAVSEYVLSCLFSHFATRPNTAKWNRSWPRKLLSDARVLIIGFGHIGKTVFQCLFPLCENLDVYDPFKGRDLNLDKTYDVIICCSSLNCTSKGQVDLSILKLLADEGVFVNPARGKLVKQVELFEHLKNHPKITAYLDVFEQEPADFSILRQYPNLHITAHLAGVYENISDEVIRFEREVIEDFIYKNKSFTTKYASEILKNRIVEEKGKKFIL